MKFIKRLITFIVLSVAVFAAFLIWSGYDAYSRAVESEPLYSRVERVKDSEHYTELSALPDTYLNAVVAVEDQRFYLHSGIDVASTVRAIINCFRAKDFVEGGSTITQQLAKNLYFSQEKQLTRKVAELFMAFEIEANYSKEEILELYINCIYYGSGYYNIYDASMGYFGVEPAAMTDYQATLLAGIPNAPSIYSLDASPELAAKRQQVVLSCMTDCGYITYDEADTILAEGALE